MFLRARLLANSVGFVLAGFPSPLAPPATAPQAPPALEAQSVLDAVLDRAATYLAGYEKDLTYVLATERYTQEIASQVPLDQSMPRTRATESEMYFVFAQASGHWVAVRDVKTVDGRGVPAGPNVAELFRAAPDSKAVAAVKAFNARFNIGRTPRNFNEPTLSLLILERQRQKGTTFKVAGETDGGATVRIAFEEHGDDTLLRDLSLKPAPATGEFRIDKATGAIRRAELKADLASVRVELTTTYRLDEDIAMMVPAEFEEHYEDGMPGGAPLAQLSNPTRQSYEDIWCRATYENYRRFAASGRIK